MFVSHDTLDPLLVATQFGAAGRGRARPLHDAVDRVAARLREGDRAALRVGDLAARPTGSRSRSSTRSPSRPRRRGAAARGSRSSRFNVDRGERSPLRVHRRGPARVRGARRRRDRSARAADDSRRCSRRRPVAPVGGAASEGRLRGSRRRPRRPRRRPSSGSRRRRGSSRARSRRPSSEQQGRPRALRRRRGGDARRAARAIKQPRAAARRGCSGGGYDLLPDDLSLVADGTLDFVVDQQPYVQGFAAGDAALPGADLARERSSPGTRRRRCCCGKADVQAVRRHEEPLRGQLEPARVPAAPRLRCRRRRWLVLAVGHRSPRPRRPRSTSGWPCSRRTSATATT